MVLGIPIITGGPKHVNDFVSSPRLLIKLICIFRLSDLYLPLEWVVCIFRLSDSHLPLGWFASSAWVVCRFRSRWFASSAAGGIPTTPQHTDSHPCISPPLGGHEWTLEMGMFAMAGGKSPRNLKIGIFGPRIVAHSSRHDITETLLNKFNNNNNNNIKNVG